MSLSCCTVCCMFFFFKQKTAYEMRISDWSSDVCSSDLNGDKLIADHQFSEAVSISGRARYIDAKATFRELYPDVYTNPSNPFIDGTADTGRIVNRHEYQTKPHAKIYTSAVNMHSNVPTTTRSQQYLVKSEERRDWNQRDK